MPGRQAVRAARPQVTELRRFARRTPDLARNLRIMLEDFDDPDRAVEPDPRSPGGRGYSGTQALLRYVFSQSLTINGFDELGLHGARRRVHRQVLALRGRRAREGPRPQGVPRLARAQPAGRDDPRPLGGAQAGDILAAEAPSASRRRGRSRRGARAPATHTAGRRAAGAGPAARHRRAPAGLGRLLDGLLGNGPKDLPKPDLDDRSTQPLLDFLLGP